MTPDLVFFKLLLSQRDVCSSVFNENYALTFVLLGF